jgi:hypothetical protein
MFTVDPEEDAVKDVQTKIQNFDFAGLFKMLA